VGPGNLSVFSEVKVIERLLAWNSLHLAADLLTCCEIIVSYLQNRVRVMLTASICIVGCHPEALPEGRLFTLTFHYPALL
jgi:hypothetical protein